MLSKKYFYCWIEYNLNHIKYENRSCHKNVGDVMKQSQVSMELLVAIRWTYYLMKKKIVSIANLK